MSITAPGRSWSAVVAAVLIRPWLWTTAIGQVFRLSPTGWWRHPPFVPRPDPDYVRFRVATQQGGGQHGNGQWSGAPDPDDVPDAQDVVEYLAWCRSLGSSTIGRSARR